MTEIEIVTFVGLMALLAVGLVLMFAPITSNDHSVDLSNVRLREPKIDGAELLIDIQDTIRQNHAVIETVVVAEHMEERKSHDQAENNAEEVLTSGMEAQSTGDETCFLIATNEVKADKMQPALWAKAIVLNEGSVEKARYQYIRLRVDQMMGQTSPPATESKVGADSDWPDDSGAGTPDAIGEERDAGGRSILSRELVFDAISRKTSVSNFVTPTRFLSDYWIRDYASQEDIRGSASEDDSLPRDASSFFGKYRHRRSVSDRDILDGAEPEMVAAYLKDRQFQYKATVDYFDEVIVVTLLPGTSRTEFLVISPPSELEGEFFGDLLSSSRITELSLAAESEPGGVLALYVELERILEYFRSPQPPTSQ